MHFVGDGNDKNALFPCLLGQHSNSPRELANVEGKWNGERKNERPRHLENGWDWGGKDQKERTLASGKRRVPWNDGMRLAGECWENGTECEWGLGQCRHPQFLSLLRHFVCFFRLCLFCPHLKKEGRCSRQLTFLLHSMVFSPLGLLSGMRG